MQGYLKKCTYNAQKNFKLLRVQHKFLLGDVQNEMNIGNKQFKRATYEGGYNRTLYHQKE